MPGPPYSRLRDGVKGQPAAGNSPGLSPNAPVPLKVSVTPLTLGLHPPRFRPTSERNGKALLLRVFDSR